MLKSKELLPHLVIGSEHPEYSIIWLHGLGADGHDFETLIEQLTIPENVRVRHILPHAPKQPVTLNGGVIMPSWFDLLDFAKVNAKQDVEGLHRAMDWIQDLIRSESRHGVADDKIFLAGFSQGAVLAMHTGLRYPKKLAGILALSTYLGDPPTLEAKLAPANVDIPFFMAHGISDPVIPVEIGRASRDLIEHAGVKVMWHEYDMAHTIIPEEIADIAVWFNDTISQIHEYGHKAKLVTEKVS